MNTMDDQLIRIDQVTGCRNLIAFAEVVTALCNKQSRFPFSIVVIDINGMGRVNQAKGYAEGNNILRWVALLAQAVLRSEIYRIDGDEFVGILTGEQNTQAGRDLFEQLNARGEDFGLQVPLASVSVIHYKDTLDLRPSDFFAQIYCSISDVKASANRGLLEVESQSLNIDNNAKSIRRCTDNLVSRLINLGSQVEESFRLAYVDPISCLPNGSAARLHIDAVVEKAAETGSAFCLLLLDGDDLRKFNEVSYAEGDRMIRWMGEIIRRTLRPEDFLARWRTGDEFVVVLERQDIVSGLVVGDRICRAIQEASLGRGTPVTVSVGVAVFPQHGCDQDSLIRSAEQALSMSKKNGKNRVSVYLPKEEEKQMVYA
jgi:diguanylate cyclase (GGDEF)-like protein